MQPKILETYSWASFSTLKLVALLLGFSANQSKFALVLKPSQNRNLPKMGLLWLVFVSNPVAMTDCRVEEIKANPAVLQICFNRSNLFRHPIELVSELLKR